MGDEVLRCVAEYPRGGDLAVKRLGFGMRGARGTDRGLGCRFRGLLVGVLYIHLVVGDSFVGDGKSVFEKVFGWHLEGTKWEV